MERAGPQVRLPATFLNMSSPFATGLARCGGSDSHSGLDIVTQLTDNSTVDITLCSVVCETKPMEGGGEAMGAGDLGLRLRAPSTN
jgi:hypothetical protein